MKYKEITPYYYSNCLLECVKAKLRDPSIRITIVYRSEANTPHFLWSDGKYDYDFGISKELKLWQIIWFKGCIRRRELGFNERYKESMRKRYSRREYERED